MIRQADVISPVYKGLQVELHMRPEGYGDRGDKWAPAVRDLVEQYQATSVLDYGCGQGSLGKALRPMCGAHVRIDEYDPAIPGKTAWPDFADLVVCTDMLEHSEPHYLDNILTHLWMLKRKAVFAVVSTRASSRTLADGRNAHLIIEKDDWWLDRFERAGFVVTPGPRSPHPKPSRELSVILT